MFFGAVTRALVEGGGGRPRCARCHILVYGAPHSVLTCVPPFFVLKQEEKSDGTYFANQLITTAARTFTVRHTAAYAMYSTRVPIYQV